MSGQDIERRVYGPAISRRRAGRPLPALRALLALPLLIVLIPLAVPMLFARAQQAGRPRPARSGARADDERVDAGPARSRFSGPTHPAAALLEDGEKEGFARERTEPVLVPHPDGSGRAWLLCVEYEVGAGDRIAVREIGPDGKLALVTGDGAGASVAKPPLLVSTTPGAIVRPVAAVDAAGRLVVVWTELANGRAELRLARADAAGRGFSSFSAPATLAGGPPGPRRNPEIVRHDDGSDATLWLAFEQWRPGEAGARGSFDVVLAPLLEAGLGEPVVIGAGRTSDLDPVLASTRGRLAVAWCSYRDAGRDYEILLRCFDPASGTLSPELNVTADAAADDVHPAIAAAPDGSLWLAWDRLEDPARGTSTPPEIRAELGAAANPARPVATSRRDSARCSVRIANVRLADDGAPAAALLPRSRGLDGKPAPAGELAGAPLHSFSGGTPRLAIAAGRVHVVHRFLAREGPGGKAYGFPVLSSAIDEQGIGPPVMLASSAGSPEEPAACASGAGLLVAWQQDHRLENETGTLVRTIPPSHHHKLARAQVVLTGSLAPSGIAVARLESTGSGAATAVVPRPERLAPPHFHPSGEDLADPIVNGADHLVVESGPRPGLESGPVRYQVFFGDLHRHSSVSRCSRGMEPGAADRWTFGRDVSL